MSGITITDMGFEVDAGVIAASFGLTPTELREKMRAGDITSLCEKGEGSDEGRFRLTFHHAGRALRLTVDAAGHVLSRATFPSVRSRPKP